MADYSNDTLELFQQIGNRLKAARETRGYTLQELAAHTRINQSFLQKIEDGDLPGLPGMAFVKGFIRNYISVLQIDDADLLQDLLLLSPSDGPQSNDHIKPSNPQVLETTVERVSYMRMGLFVVLAALVLWVGFVLFQGSDEPDGSSVAVTPEGGVETSSEPAATPPPALVSIDPPADSADTQNAPPGGAGGTGSATPAAPAGTAPPASTPSVSTPPNTPTRAGAPLEGRQRLELTVRGLEPTWLRLSIDRAPPIDVMMHPADTVTWEANQEIRLTIGKSQGVAVYLNGEEILLPQEPNRLIPNLVLNKLTLLRLEN